MSCMATTPHVEKEGGPVARPPGLLAFGLARRRRPEQLEALHDEVDLLDAVTFDVADPRGDPPLDMDLATLATVLADHFSRTFPGDDIVEFDPAIDRGGDPDVEDGFTAGGEPGLRIGGHPSEQAVLVDPVRPGLRRGVDDVRL